MDKKNTMLLTVIAVATLLVAVVGATFAFFAVQTSNDNATTTVTTTTTEVGSIALSNPTASLKIALEAADMAKDNQRPYYATNASDKNYDLTSTSREIAVAKVTGGDAAAKYKCTFNVNAAVSGTMQPELVSGDAKLVINGGGLSINDDLATVVQTSKSYAASFTLTGPDATDNVKAYVEFVNTGADQSDLAGKTLTVTLSNSDFACETIK